MVYFYADLPYKGKVFRLLRAENSSDETVNAMLKRQGVIQAADLTVITLFSFCGNYQHVARTQSGRELVFDFIRPGQIPPYSMLVWAQTFLS